MTFTPNIHNKGFRIAHYNVRSLIPKLDSIKLWLEPNDIDVVTITETWLSPNIPMSMIEFENYHILRQDRTTGKKRGGLLRLIKKNPNLRLNEHIKKDLRISNKDAEIQTRVKVLT